MGAFPMGRGERAEKWERQQGTCWPYPPTTWPAKLPAKGCSGFASILCLQQAKNEELATKDR